MPGPNATGSQSEGHASVTERLQASPKSKPGPRSPCPDVAWVFPDHNARANFINNPEELTAETLVFRFTGTNCRTICLAGVASTYNVDSFEVVLSAFAHVAFSVDVWPVFFEDALVASFLVDCVAKEFP